MQHIVKVTVLDKKLYPELQAQYCAVPESGKCPCFNVGDEFVFFRNDERDDFWHCGEGTLVKAGQPDEGCLQSPGTAHSGSKGVPFCSEAWDAISRYIYTGLQGGSIMRGWMNDERVMITCCSDGTRPVIFKIERLDYFAVWFEGILGDTECEQIRSLLGKVEGVTDVVFRKKVEGEYVEVYVNPSVTMEEILNAVKEQKNFRIVRVD